jgi:UDP-glucuronate decarboxylase
MQPDASLAGSQLKLLKPRNYDTKKRILVTGGAGFIGSHLCDLLVYGGNYVICVDNFYTGTHENILHLRNCKNFEVIRHDITFPLYLEVDQIYNMACPASPVHYQHDPVQTTKTSVHGAINMLGLAKRTGARILQASTSEVYGDPTVHPQPEDYWGNVNPTGPRACYDEGKRCAETLFFDYHRQYGVDIRVARIFNTYGPRMHANDGRVVSNFIMQALQHKPLTIYGDGTQSRSFCYVEDMIFGLISLMNIDGPTLVNLGNPQELTVMQLGTKILKMINGHMRDPYAADFDFKSLPLNDPRQRQPNIDEAIDGLSWKPLWDIDQGLQKTIEYFKWKFKE